MKVLIRLGGEIAVKSKVVRKKFCNRLMKNIKDALYKRKIEGKVLLTWERIYLEYSGDSSCDFLKNIYGIQSYSPIEYECSADLGSMTTTALNYKSQIANKTFCIRARRNGSHDFSSMDVQKVLGSALFKESRGVDIKNPEFVINVEIKDQKCLFFSEIIKAPGGLPLGSGGHAVCLLSGGFDSAVAAWMLQRRGVTIDFIFCNIGGLAHERSVLRLAKTLSDRCCDGYRPRLHITDISDFVKSINSSTKKQYAQVLLKRTFYRLAEKLANTIDASAIVTGEAIGQVSSQTLANLRVIDDVAFIPVLRPLLTFDKDDIIKLSREIGTYEISEKVQEFCQISHVKPATAAKLQNIKDEEDHLDLSSLNDIFEQRKIVDLNKINESQLTLPYIFKDSIDTNDVVIDCRTSIEFQDRHYPGALHIEFYDLMTTYQKLAKQKTYIIYCSVGMQSAQIAEKMQRDGYLAYSYNGGAKKLLNS